MTSDPDPPVSRRVLTVVFAMALGLALVGFLVGTRPAGHRGRQVPVRADRTAAKPARSYTELRRLRAARRGGGELAGLATAVPTAAPRARPTDAQRRAALRARAQRRAYSGAPPVIPHGITEKSSASCLTCHRRGVVISGKVAPTLPHPEHASCTQCHVAGAGRGPNHMPAATNRFAGVRTAGRSTRIGLGAPPTIPHTTWMRSRCLACHGPAGKPGLRTTHPQRRSCTQCHAPNWRRHPAAGVPR